MMKIFSETRNKVSDEPTGEHTPEAVHPEAAPQPDRLAQGIDLLFGSHLREQRAELEALEARLSGGLALLQEESTQRAQALESLNDKAQATLEREKSEQVRRKAAESALHQRINEFSEMVTGSIGQLHERNSQLEKSLGELLEQREAGSSEAVERHEAILTQLTQGIAHLKANTVDRKELAGLLAALAMRLDPPQKAEGKVEASVS